MAKRIAKRVSEALSADNTFTKWIEITGQDFHVEVSGTFAGTLDLQFEDELGAWITTGDTVDLGLHAGVNPSKQKYRLGFPTGSFTSGTAQVAIIADSVGDVEV